MFTLEDLFEGKKNKNIYLKNLHLFEEENQQQKYGGTYLRFILKSMQHLFFKIKIVGIGVLPQKPLGFSVGEENNGMEIIC